MMVLARLPLMATKGKLINYCSLHTKLIVIKLHWSLKHVLCQN